MEPTEYHYITTRIKQEIKMHRQSIHGVVYVTESRGVERAQLGVLLHIRRAHYALLGDLDPRKHTNTYLALSCLWFKSHERIQHGTIRFAWTPSFLACLLCFGSHSTKALYGVAFTHCSISTIRGLLREEVHGDGIGRNWRPP